MASRSAASRASDRLTLCSLVLSTLQTEVLGVDENLVTHHHGTTYPIDQFTNVPRPGVAIHDLQGIFAKALDTLAALVSEAMEDIIGQERDVSFAELAVEALRICNTLRR